MSDEEEKSSEEEEMSYQEKIDNDICPECGGPLRHHGGCIECRDCWFSLCGG